MKKLAVIIAMILGMPLALQGAQKDDVSVVDDGKKAFDLGGLIGAGNIEEFSKLFNEYRPISQPLLDELLKFASRNQKVDIMNFLLKAGANPNLVKMQGAKKADEPAPKKDEPAPKKKENKWAKITVPELRQLIIDNNGAEIDDFLNNYVLSKSLLNPLLSIALQNGHVDTAKKLLNKGADPNYAPRGRPLLLEWALRYPDTGKEIPLLLIDAGADLYKKDETENQNIMDRLNSYEGGLIEAEFKMSREKIRNLFLKRAARARAEQEKKLYKQDQIKF